MFVRFHTAIRTRVFQMRSGPAQQTPQISPRPFLIKNARRSYPLVAPIRLIATFEVQCSTTELSALPIRHGAQPPLSRNARVPALPSRHDAWAPGLLALPARHDARSPLSRGCPLPPLLHRVADAFLLPHAVAAVGPLPTSPTGLLSPINSTSRRSSIFPSSKEMLRCAENTCCKSMFHVFQVFHRYIAIVSYGCCKSRSRCCICGNGCTRMLQWSVFNVSSMFSNVCCKCVLSGCCICFIDML
jgi:hypothetical protein